MLMKLYLTGFATLLLAAVSGLAYCLILFAEGDPRGIANIGKLLLVALYCSYRLWAILSRRYLIYRSWETASARKTKGLLHGVLVTCLCLLACALLATIASLAAIAPMVVLMLLCALLAIFLALEVINALGNTPVNDRA